MKKTLSKYSFGIGDRFGQEGPAQLHAVMKARELGIDLTPVWNKSYREHTITGTDPADVRNEADEAIKKLGWEGSWFVDADHINLGNVDGFIDSSDYFTIDIAERIGMKADVADVDDFITRNKQCIGRLDIPGIDEEILISRSDLERLAHTFLNACKAAAEIYRYIARCKGTENFIAEVSMDEVETPQKPAELFLILSALAAYGIPLQTIAPKFTGRFNKGVDYEGDVDAFKREFEQDLLVIDYAVQRFGLPENLKLSVHSGSDKFSIYPVMGDLIRKYDRGIHIKTAGTTWLEEVTGLALAGGEGLAMAKEIYRQAYDRLDELCAPYADVIDIQPAQLPPPGVVQSWDGETFVATLRHEQMNPNYNLHFRQLIHVGYKVAAELGDRFTGLLSAHRQIVGEQVTNNLFTRHIMRLFGT